MNADQLLTYEEAAARLGRKKQFISRRVAKGLIVVTDLGYNTKRISELDLLKFIERSRAIEKIRNQPITNKSGSNR
jgi:excisionase family DNA binding protein